MWKNSQARGTLLYVLASVNVSKADLTRTLVDCIPFTFVRLLAVSSVYWTLTLTLSLPFCSIITSRAYIAVDRHHQRLLIIIIVAAVIIFNTIGLAFDISHSHSLIHPHTHTHTETLSSLRISFGLVSIGLRPICGARNSNTLTHTYTVAKRYRWDIVQDTIRLLFSSDLVVGLIVSNNNVQSGSIIIIVVSWALELFSPPQTKEVDENGNNH